LLDDENPDGPLSDEFVAAFVDVLKEWHWERRPTAVATMPSRRRPGLITSAGERLATLGRLEWLGALDRIAAFDQQASRTNSAQRVRALHAAFGVDARQRAALEQGDHVVLLLDDLIDSGWTIALATRELRRAGAAAVLPLAFATQA
jgi:ATP-dependent DNA helicase RecQ